MPKTHLFQSPFPNKILHPILEPQQIQYRNRHHKNWGQFRVYGWKNGHPKWFITSFIMLFWLLVYFISIFGKILWQGNLDYFKILILAHLIILNIVALVIFYRQNPNISSNSLPLLDEQNFRNQVNFCTPCKIIKKQNIFHCPKCKICIQKQYFHSQLLKTCISKGNLKQIIFLYVSIILFSSYSLYIV